MEEVRTFFESSTIHGLVYISQTKRSVKIFWILVVIAGFVGAGVLIFQSFDSWAESPEKTIIRTEPIQEVRFPKVIVCPHKNTFTNLNYDLMMPSSDIELDDTTASKLIDSLNVIAVPKHVKKIIFSFPHVLTSQ